ncbi:MAG: leucyl aminopeptidase [Actinomycetota bacterium]|nr:leucyl aminopeptidase [Actinomycetota bacterium]
MTTLSLSSSPAERLSVDALVIGVGKGPKGPVVAAGAEGLDKALGGRLAKTLAALGATGADGTLTRFATLGACSAATVAAVGLGPVPARGGRYDAESLRRAAGSAVRALAGVAKVGMTLAAANGAADPVALRAVAEGALLGGYSFDRFRSPARLDGHLPPVGALTLVVADARSAAAKAALRRAEVVTQAVGLARDLVNTPPGHLHPQDLAEAARTEATRLGLTVEVLDEKALRKGGYGGILGVGQGSANPPRLVRIAYSPPEPVATVALVGKGITFDSGGLSLKPAQAMEWMKSDMGGAAAVLAALSAVATLELPVAVVGWLPTAENMPSGGAIRPSDVLTMYGGTRVEVLNTDAEGRLILGDALARASEDEPDYLIDVATLTGAQLVALGTRTAGVMGNDDELRAAVLGAAAEAGEAMWPMPLPDHLRKSLDSEVADLANIGDRNGGMLVAAVFLREFVGAGTKWAHLDIAGPAFNQGDAFGYTPRGGTGAAVRTFVQFCENLSTNRL